MDICILSIGLKEPAWITEARLMYTKRLSSYTQMHWQALKESPNSATKKQQESLRLIDTINQRPRRQHSCRIALTEQGQTFTSLAFSQQLQQWQQHYSQLIFVIAGADGFDPCFYKEVDHCLSLSTMTLPHMLCRILLAEQLYRAFSLLSGHPYHRA